MTPLFNVLLFCIWNPYFFRSFTSFTSTQVTNTLVYMQIDRRLATRFARLQALDRHFQLLLPACPHHSHTFLSSSDPTIRLLWMVLEWPRGMVAMYAEFACWIIDQLV